MLHLTDNAILVVPPGISILSILRLHVCSVLREPCNDVFSFLKAKSRYFDEKCGPGLLPRGFSACLLGAEVFAKLTCYSLFHR